MKNEKIGMENVDVAVETTCVGICEDNKITENSDETGGCKESVGEVSATETPAEEINAETSAEGEEVSANEEVEESAPVESAEEAYLRGRNDAIREMLSSGGLYDRPSDRSDREQADADSLTSGFLTHLRPSAWD